LFKQRTLVISSDINQALAGDVTVQLLAMANESDDPITLFINSQGGHVESGDTIHEHDPFRPGPRSNRGDGLGRERRNFWLDAQGAKEYGLVGHIIETISDLK
jgi:ATP-dependent protease ClpP protease subunit